MNSRAIQISGLILMVFMVLAAGCGSQAEAPAPEIVQEPVVIVVTATEVPPTPTPDIVFVVVTATNEPEVPGEEAVVIEATAVPTDTPEAVAESGVEANAVQETAVEMSLTSQRTTTQHSPRPEPFVEPQAIEDFLPPSNWTDIQPDQSTPFRSYDGIRVLEGGEAIIDLGDLMRLVLKHDSEMQPVPGSLVQEELNKIRVDFGKSPMLQQIALAAHLFRGGFLGEKRVGTEPIALTTPNAVILISGTTFFLMHDPDAQVTYVGNFEGTIDVADVDLEEGEALPGRSLFAIPAVRNRKEWPLHPHMTMDEFSRLIDLQESPIAAADMISGPYLRVKYRPELTVRRGPGTEFSYLGTIKEGEYARIIGRGLGWWQIECPETIQANACWVSGGAAYVDAYNVDLYPVPDTAPEIQPTATPRPAVRPTSAPIGNGDVVDCRYIGNNKFEWYTAAGEGPMSGIWQSGCPVEPKVSIRGCEVQWEAYNDSVVEATMRINRTYFKPHMVEDFEQFTPSLPAGSRHLGLPSEFYGADVEVFFDVTLFNGVKETKKDSRTWEYDEGDPYGC